MNISNLMGQYSQASSAKAEKLTGRKGVETLSSSIKALKKGNIFEGTVSSMKNGRVTLALSNGTQLSARLDGKISLSVGESMFFQVKSNEGSQIAIRPFVSDSGGVNITLMQALAAAGLPAEENYLSMVNKMMEEQMPIDKSSLQQMARLVNTNSGIDVSTVVQMCKLGIPITMENALQFESYLGDRQAITNAFDELIGMLPEAMQGSGLSDEGLRQMNAQVLSVVTENLAPEQSEPQAAENPLLIAAADAQAAAEAEMAAGSLSAEGEQTGVQENAAASDAQGAIDQAQPDSEAVSVTIGEANGDTTAVQAGQTQESAPQPDGVPGKELPPEDAAEQAKAGNAAEGEKAEVSAEGVKTESAAGEASVKQTDAARGQGVEITLEAGEPAVAEEHTLGAVLNKAQLAKLGEQLGALVGRERVTYPPKQEVSAFLNDLQQLLKSEFPVDRGSLQRLLASDSFKLLVKDALEQQWTIRPDELSDSDQINRLYEKQNSQMNRMEAVLRATGQESASLARMVSDIRGNVDFMNQINQIYSYVQIPLKMSGQNASGELYVYTNKKALAQGDRDLTAFLHLDMENLGPTDVAVRMRGKEVSTNFFLENDAAYDLLERHLPILEARLKSKGYNCSITVKNETKHVNFVEDFLKKDQPSAGQLHRYSFDMRA